MVRHGIQTGTRSLIGDCLAAAIRSRSGSAVLLWLMALISLSPGAFGAQVLGAQGDSGTQSPIGSRLVVLGIDGLDLRLLDKLVSQGGLPNFARLYAEGAVGPVSTAEAGLPPQSPAIWTSFATGQPPEVHRIWGFLYDPGPVQRLWSLVSGDETRLLQTSTHRRAPAIWEIAASAGKKAGVVNWCITYPAEPIQGFVVSDRYFLPWARALADFHRAALDRDASASVHPPELLSTLDRVPKPSLSSSWNAQSAETIDQYVLSLAFAALKINPIDLLLIYTRSLDELSHMRWDTHEPLRGESPRRDEIIEFLRRYDGMLASVLGILTSEDHLVILSDHGFERNAGPHGPPGVHESRESAVGTLMLRGPRIVAGRRLSSSGLLDVTPTLLELLGLPPARNMPGKVIEQAFRESGRILSRRAEPYQRIPSTSAKGAFQADDSTVERLRSLGYIE